MQNKRWTKEEDDRLIKIISHNPQNLVEAFRQASIILVRSEKAISERWYKTLAKKSNTCFITIGSKTVNRNRKVVSINTTDNTTQNKISKWRRILNILFE